MNPSTFTRNLSRPSLNHTLNNHVFLLQLIGPELQAMNISNRHARIIYRAGSISIIFVDVGYRFFSIIFDDFDFGFDVDFFFLSIIAISISIFFL
jgi:hypothetical protein